MMTNQLSRWTCPICGEENASDLDLLDSGTVLMCVSNHKIVVTLGLHHYTDEMVPIAESKKSLLEAELEMVRAELGLSDVARLFALADCKGLREKWEAAKAELAELREKEAAMHTSDENIETEVPVCDDVVRIIRRASDRRVAERRKPV